MQELRQKIKDLQTLKEEKGKQLNKEITIAQEINIKFEQEKNQLKNQQSILKSKKLENDDKLSQLINLKEQLLLEKDFILNKIMKDEFNTENWDTFIKGMKMTKVTLKRGLKGTIYSTAGLASTGFIATAIACAVAAACLWRRWRKRRIWGREDAFVLVILEDVQVEAVQGCSISPSFGIGLGGGVITGISLGVGIGCPVTWPILFLLLLLLVEQLLLLEVLSKQFVVLRKK